VLDKSDAGDMAVIRRGWAARYVLFHDGRRQITDVLLPSDFVGCNHVLPTHEALPVIALSDAEACIFEGDVLLAHISSRQDHLLQLMRVCSSKTARLWQLLAAMGRQSGAPRVAAFLLALHNRLKEIGDADETKMPYHLRQQDLADILGMTQVHVSRTMRTLHDAGILTIGNQTATILNPHKLERLAKT
jgi:CRP-like cAMP-binding protein